MPNIKPIIEISTKIPTIAKDAGVKAEETIGKVITELPAVPRPPLQIGSKIEHIGGTKDINIVGKRFVGADGKPKITHVFTDIDYTLTELDPYKMSAADIKALDALHEHNIPVILTTGRTYDDTIPIIQQLKSRPDYTICCRGGKIVDKEGKILLNNVIPEESGKKIIKWFDENFAKENDYHLVMYFNDRPYSLTNIQFPWEARTPITQIKSFDELFSKGEQLEKVVLYKQNNTVKEAEFINKAHAKEDFSELVFEDTGDGLFEFQNVTASKDKAIKMVMDKEGIADHGCIMAIGDSSNDIAMLDYAREHGGLGVVMGNAKDKIKALHGNAVTEGVGDSGFYHAVKSFIPDLH